MSSGPRAGLRLVVEAGGADPRLVVVPSGGALRMGRADDQDLVLADGKASRQHAVISFDGQRAALEDLGSSNGTWVGERRVAGRCGLVTGDVVRVGATRVVVALVTPESDARGDEQRPVLLPGEVAEDPATVRVFRLLARLAPTTLPVLLQGETGCGKEVAARALHRRSSRAGGPFVAINCATLPEGLAESELFGHERGAFSGAVARRLGAFEAASGGTLLLDEVGELSLASQARLLRVLQEKVIVRVGSSAPVPVDVRLVAATNRDLAAEVDRRRFRSDLYFRLDGATVAIPPLRARPLDIVPLAERVLSEAGGVAGLGPGVLAALVAYRWPGNVRELRNVIERALALGEGGRVTLDDLPPSVLGRAATADTPRESGPSLRDPVDATERAALVAALEAVDGNQSKAARALGITRRAMIYRMERHGLKPRPMGGSEER